MNLYDFLLGAESGGGMGCWGYGEPNWSGNVYSFFFGFKWLVCWCVSTTCLPWSIKISSQTPYFNERHKFMGAFYAIYLFFSFFSFSSPKSADVVYYPPLRHEAIEVCFVVNPPLKPLPLLLRPLDNLHY